MGQSPYLCFGSAGFCCWGLGMGRPFPAQITTQGHRGTLFSGRFQISGDRGTQLLRAAAPMSKKTLVGAAIRSREDHSDEKITHHEVGWSPLRNHPINVRGGQVSDWEESQMLAALAVSELPAALQ